jgi:hypothetical protein
LNATAQKIFNSLNFKKEFELQVQPNLKLFSNAFAIEQILINLLSNGIKYNKSDTVILNIQLIDTESYYKLIVSDNGIGIAEAYFSDIFSSFKTLNIKDRYNNYGTGIGLATVKNIVEKLEGSITIDSKLNSGTVFTILLKK